jgi:two-component system LytT family response regulator
MKCIIVDDEYPSREELKYFIENFSDIEIAHEFEDPLEVLKYLQENNVDIIFLDINMPNLDGMTLGKLVSKFNKKPEMVFITAYDHYAVDAFDIQAFDYIMKPYSEERIVNTLNRLERRFNVKTDDNKESQCNTKLTIWKGDKMQVLCLDDVYYCEACERETKIFTEKDVYMSKLKISDLENKLPKDRFFRCHRSYIVNVDKISEIIPWFNSTYNLKFRGLKDEVPVSRGRVKEFKDIMSIK